MVGSDIVASADDVKQVRGGKNMQNVRNNGCDSVMNVSSVPREEMNVDIGRSGGEKNMLGENVEAEVIEGSTISDQRDMRIKGCDDDLDIITRWENLFTNNSSEGQERMLANPCLLHKVIHCYTRQREKGELNNDSIKIADILNKAAGMGVTTQKDATKAAVVNIVEASVSNDDNIIIARGK
jgi:hypothetical protein